MVEGGRLRDRRKEKNRDKRDERHQPKYPIFLVSGHSIGFSIKGGRRPILYEMLASGADPNKRRSGNSMLSGEAVCG